MQLPIHPTMNLHIIWLVNFHHYRCHNPTFLGLLRNVQQVHPIRSWALKLVARVIDAFANYVICEIVLNVAASEIIDAARPISKTLCNLSVNRWPKGPLSDDSGRWRTKGLLYFDKENIFSSKPLYPCQSGKFSIENGSKAITAT